MTSKRPPFTMLTRRDFLQLLGLTTTTAALTACGAPAAQEDADSTTVPEQIAGEPRRGGTLRVAFASTITKFDPALASIMEEFHSALAIYEGLVRVDQNLAPQPGLATAWEASDDLLTWTFTLREGVTFQHGAPVTAQDVVYTYERILDPDLGSPAQNMLTAVERVEAVDDMTVRFSLNNPIADFLLYTASPRLVIVPHDYNAEQLASEPSGSGPFRLGEQRPGEQTTFIRNETYWDGSRPYLDDLRFVYIAESPTRVEALRSGTVDVIYQLGPEVAPVLEQSNDVRVSEIPGGGHTLIAMDVTAPPFDDLRVRQAFKHCVDREGVLQAVLQGRGMLGNDQPISPADPNWADVAPLANDIERAKELLAEAGYADGLEVTLTTSEVRPGMVPLSVAFQEMAKSAGITITIDQLPAETFWTEGYMQTNLFTGNWPMYESPDIMLSEGYQSGGAWHETGWDNPDLDALIVAARGEADPAERQDLYRQIQETISRDGGVIISTFRPFILAMRPNVQGLQQLPTEVMLFQDVWLAQS